MKIKLVKYWKIELFEQSKDKSVISNMMNEPKRPFFTGYSKEPIKPHNLQGGDFISLATYPDFIETKSVRTYRVDEFKCTPVYENDDAFQEAAKPLIKWLNENANPHSQVVVTSTGAELLVGERVYNTEKFLKD
ncbi:hypothetical protein CBK78_14150 [Salmonella enterica]|nr:hypothetical protein [Salmonella enterica]EBL7700925.1 hypothetical protein [Salmonella enterica]EEK9235353.1 hypothetical protein [Salmonella enterica]EJI0923230.1 hypothetical protein [Salmonella enterica]EJP6308630.1 hypothetical protein [Salmonella enterica]